METARYQTLGSVHANLPRFSQSRSTIYLAAAVAAFCAATVFFLLCERDHSLLSQTGVSPAPPTIIQPSESTAPVPAAAPGAQVDVPRRDETPFNLERSRRFHRVGPVNIGIWRIDPRHASFDLSILAYGRRINKNRVKLDETVSINTKDPARSLKLVVNKIDRTGVSGYLIQD